MANTLKIVSVLLSYPDEQLKQDMPAIVSAIAADDLTGTREKAWLTALARDLDGCDVYDAQERYVSLFDRTRSLSLHLFEHVHGESRDRGQAMVDLAQMYEAQGFDIGAREMPDYLPLFLEYLSILPDEEARSLLGQTLHIITSLRTRLQKRNSIYANALLVLEAVARTSAEAAAVEALLAAPEDDPSDLAALDAVWEAEAVTFGGGAGDPSCGPERLRMQVRAARRPAPQPQPIGDS